MLAGCHNDIDGMEYYLKSVLSVPTANIIKLKDAEAKRDRIISELVRIATDERIREGDQILFQFSGHGSRMVPPLEWNCEEALIETIVPYDGRTNDVYDIPDKILQVLLHRICENKGKNVTVIFDSCHSGSATRVTALQDLDFPKSRFAKLDLRQPPLNLDKEYLENRPMTSSIPYVYLASAQRNQLAYEYWIPQQIASSDGGSLATEDLAKTKYAYGAFSYFLLQALYSSRELSYEELIDIVRNAVQKVYFSQSPVCLRENRSRMVLGTAERQRPLRIQVRRVFEDGTVELDKGILHDISVGTKIKFYSPEILSVDNNTLSLGILLVRQATPTRSRAVAETDEINPIPERAQGIVVERPQPEFSLFWSETNPMQKTKHFSSWLSISIKFATTHAQIKSSFPN